MPRFVFVSGIRNDRRIRKKGQDGRKTKAALPRGRRKMLSLRSDEMGGGYRGVFVTGEQTYLLL